MSNHSPKWRMYWFPFAFVYAFGEFLVFVDAALMAVLPYRWSYTSQCRRTWVGRWGSDIECECIRKLLNVQE